MKKTLSIVCVSAALSACTTLTRQETTQLQQLKAHGITIDRPAGSWEKPASAGFAAGLNILPGFGNFYLASGNAAESTHWIYGALNLLFWPISVLWGVPEAAVDANNINQRDLLYYYSYDKRGKEELKEAGVTLE